MNDFESWARESAIAQMIDVSTKVVLLDTAATEGELKHAASRTITIPKKQIKQKAPFALEAGGKIVARGRIVKRFGVSYFKVAEIEKEGKDD